MLRMKKMWWLVAVSSMLAVTTALGADYFTASGNPSTGASLSSSIMRSEFASIATGFTKIAGYTGNGGKLVAINAGGTAQEAVTSASVAQGGTGRATSTTAYGLIAAGTTATGAHQTLAAGATTEILVGGGASALPVWTAATGSGAPVRATSPVLVTPALGTPASGVMTNVTGTAAGLTAGNVTTNANLTGPITSVGNATSVGSQTGTGSTFVMSASPYITGELQTDAVLTSHGTLSDVGTVVTNGAANAEETVIRSITSIANAVATDLMTVTVPNASHSAAISIHVRSALGAGGAIGAGEASHTFRTDFIVTRTAGVATTVAAATAYGTATTNVAGGTTMTVTPGVSAVSGGVGATQTFTIQLTIARGSGSSTNHTALVVATILNANASGITLN